MPLQAPTCAPGPITGTFVTGVTQAVRLPALMHQYSVAAHKIHTSTRRQEKTPRTSSCSSTGKGMCFRISSVQMHTQTANSWPPFCFPVLFFFPLSLVACLSGGGWTLLLCLLSPHHWPQRASKGAEVESISKGKHYLGVQKGCDGVLGSVAYAFLCLLVSNNEEQRRGIQKTRVKLFACQPYCLPNLGFSFTVDEFCQRCKRAVVTNDALVIRMLSVNCSF